MESKVKILGHPAHTMLIPFPLGLLGMAAIFDIVHALVPDAGTLSVASHVMIGAGVLTGLLAAVFGAIDWAALSAGTRAKQIATTHGLGNVVVLLLFTIAWFMRREEPATVPTLTLLIEIVAFALAGFTGWLGGELVDRLGVGVDRGAHLNAPSSLSNRAATD